MRKLTMLMAVLAAGVANADSGGSSCSVLSDTIYRQVAAGGNGGRRVATLPARMPGPFVCRDTARAVSRGFTRAMAERNFYVTWPTTERRRVDVCLNHDLSRCFPNQDPFVPLFSPHDAAFVVQQWQVVQRTVRAAMPAGTASDVSRFDPAAVAYRLQRGLQRESGSRQVFD